jgi:SAM-dependent methyltransferase
VETDEYVKLAEFEDTMWYFRALHRHVATMIRRHHPDAKGIHLEAGCGTGGFMRRASGWFPRLQYVGIDLSPIAVDLAKRKGTRGVARATSTALPFADECMSIVTSLDVLQHVAAQETAAAEFFRVLEPGGIAVINVAAYQWLWSYHDTATHALRRYTRSNLVKMFENAGFTTLQSTYWNFLPLPLVIAKRKLASGARGSDDVKNYPAMAERILDVGMAAERAWFSHVTRLPAGSSVLAAMRKPA